MYFSSGVRIFQRGVVRRGWLVRRERGGMCGSAAAVRSGREVLKWRCLLCADDVARGGRGRVWCVVGVGRMLLCRTLSRTLLLLLQHSAAQINDKEEVGSSSWSDCGEMFRECCFFVARYDDASFIRWRIDLWLCRRRHAWRV